MQMAFRLHLRQPVKINKTEFSLFFLGLKFVHLKEIIKNIIV
jgi:hypothetical protein